MGKITQALLKGKKVLAVDTQEGKLLIQFSDYVLTCKPKAWSLDLVKPK